MPFFSSSNWQTFWGLRGHSFYYFPWAVKALIGVFFHIWELYSLSFPLYFHAVSLIKLTSTCDRTSPIKFWHLENLFSLQRYNFNDLKVTDLINRACYIFVCNLIFFLLCIHMVQSSFVEYLPRRRLMAVFGSPPRLNLWGMAAPYADMVATPNVEF